MTTSNNSIEISFEEFLAGWPFMSDDEETAYVPPPAAEWDNDGDLAP